MISRERYATNCGLLIFFSFVGIVVGLVWYLMADVIPWAKGFAGFLVMPLSLQIAVISMIALIASIFVGKITGRVIFGRWNW